MILASTQFYFMDGGALCVLSKCCFDLEQLAPGGLMFPMIWSVTPALLAVLLPVVFRLQSLELFVSRVFSCKVIELFSFSDFSSVILRFPS